jgi:hypothetical protein
MKNYRETAPELINYRTALTEIFTPKGKHYVLF